MNTNRLSLSARLQRHGRAVTFTTGNAEIYCLRNLLLGKVHGVNALQPALSDPQYQTALGVVIATPTKPGSTFQQ